MLNPDPLWDLQRVNHVLDSMVRNRIIAQEEADRIALENN